MTPQEREDDDGSVPTWAWGKAMQELHREYNGPIPGGNQTIMARARWYALPAHERWRHHAKAQAYQIANARRGGNEPLAMDALKRCQHAVKMWRMTKPAPLRQAAE